jgi:hypothetical protein
MFQGMADLNRLAFPVDDLVKSDGEPTNSDALPTYRVYGPTGLIPGQAGSMAFRNSGAITDATNASPIVITSADHGLTTGTRVTITGVGGNTGANGTFVITVVNANTFSLDDSNGGGNYTSGGTWNVTGFYTASLDLTAANGYLAGEKYTVLVSASIGGDNPYGSLLSFMVN